MSTQFLSWAGLQYFWNNKVKTLLPFEKGAGTNSAIQKNGNNQAISENSIAIGSNNRAGLKGYYWNYINLTTKAIYLSTTNTAILASEPAVDTTFVNPYAVGDVYSIHMGGNYYDCGTITAIDHNKVTVNTLPFDAIVPSEQLLYYFYVFGTESNNYIKSTYGVVDFGKGAYVEGEYNYGLHDGVHTEGATNVSYGRYAHTEGIGNKAGYAAHAEGNGTKATNSHSHSEGQGTTASGRNSHAENHNTIASGEDSHAEGRSSIASGAYSHAEGDQSTAGGERTHAEGYKTKANGNYSHAEGGESEATGAYSHAEGYKTKTISSYSHTEGSETQATGSTSHAEGKKGVASGAISHVEGEETIAQNRAEHSEGAFNKSNKKTTGTTDEQKAGTTRHSVGIGASANDRKNAFEIMQNGDIYGYGIGGYNGANPATSGVKTLKQAIDERAIIGNITQTGIIDLPKFSELNNCIAIDYGGSRFYRDELANFDERLMRDLPGWRGRTDYWQVLFLYTEYISAPSVYPDDSPIRVLALRYVVDEDTDPDNPVEYYSIDYADVYLEHEE